MSFYEHQIQEAVVLALFVPLIISSGGNSGSQATTLIIRAMALREVRLIDWWRVMRRELVAGLALGCQLSAIGLIRIVVWQSFGQMYGQYYLLVAATIGFALVGVVSFGTLAGSMLPFILRRCGLDPASASAPLTVTSSALSCCGDRAVVVVLETSAAAAAGSSITGFTVSRRMSAALAASSR